MARAVPSPTTRRKRGFEAAGQLVAADLRKPAEKRGFAVGKLLTHWAEIVGADVAAIARPVKITYGRGFGGTLVLLTTGGHAPVLEMQKDTILDKVNACHGYRAISRVHITQTAPTGFAEGQVAFAPAPKAPPPEPDPARLAATTRGVETVTDTDLRAALALLGRNVLTKHRN